MRICDVLLNRIEQSNWDKVRALYPKLRNAVYIEQCFTALALMMGSVPETAMELSFGQHVEFSQACEKFFGVTQHRDIRAIYPVFFIWCRESQHEAKRKPQSKEERERWEQVSTWACRHVGLERIEPQTSYHSVFKNGARVGSTAPSGMWYRLCRSFLVTQRPGGRIYVWYRGESLDQVKETFAFLQMVHDNCEFVLLH